MKKIIYTLILLFPVLSFASFAPSDIASIELQYNEEARSHAIVYVTVGGTRLASNITTTAATESHARNRIFSVTRKLPGFKNISRSQVDRAFDWDAFVDHRRAIHGAIEWVLGLANLDEDLRKQVETHRDNY